MPEWTEDEILRRFLQINCWSRGGERAPHKPLLLLLALAQVQAGRGRWLKFREIEQQLRDLLDDYGPPRATQHPQHPFWRLRNDEGIWTLVQEGDLLPRQNRSGDVPITALREQDAEGGFTQEMYAVLSERPSLVNRIVDEILRRNFPSSIHEDLLDAIGLPWVVERDRRPVRAPEFRQDILRAYEYQCAVCEYRGRLGRADFGLEAAHVKWHAAGGPDTIDNGVALCVFHHKALDRGAIGLDDERRIMISQHLTGGRWIKELLLDFVGRPLRRPQLGEPSIADEFIRWHTDQVFRPPPRGIAES